MIGVRILPAQMAADACSAMTEQQRIAFAISLIGKAVEASSVLHLHRLERIAAMVRADIERQQQILEASR